MHKFSIILLLLLSLIAGCMKKAKPAYTDEQLENLPHPQKFNLPSPSGGFVLSVSGQTITSDEIITSSVDYFGEFARKSSLEQFKAQAWPKFEQLLMTKLTNILLYSQAKKDAGEEIDEALEKVADAEIKKFLIGYGNDYAKAQVALQQMGMDWDSFKEYQKQMILTQSYMSSKLPDEKPITYSELVSYYNQMKGEFFIEPAMLTFQLIDIEVSKVPYTDPNKTQLEKAQQLTDELTIRLRAGEDFGQLAEKYSHGHRHRFGGLWQPVRPDSLAAPYDVLAGEALKIGPGQITGPITAGGHIFIMKLIEKQLESVEPFEKVQSQIEAKIKFDRRREVVDEFGATLIQQAQLREKDLFIDFCLGKIYQISNQ